MRVGVRAPNTEADEKSAYKDVQVWGMGPQREIGFPISTDNASWVDDEINFAKISFLSHSHQRTTLKKILKFGAIIFFLLNEIIRLKIELNHSRN